MKGKLPRSRTDWSRADKIPGIPDDEIPEITREDMDRGWIGFNGIVLRGPRVPGTRGRPPGSGKKTPIHVRIDKDILAHFRATGRGWQTRLNDALRSFVEAKGRPVRKRKRLSQRTHSPVRRSA